MLIGNREGFKDGRTTAAADNLFIPKFHQCEIDRLEWAYMSAEPAPRRWRKF
jgi:hypothetical protein